MCWRPLHASLAQGITQSKWRILGRFDITSRRSPSSLPNIIDGILENIALASALIIFFKIKWHFTFNKAVHKSLLSIQEESVI